MNISSFKSSLVGGGARPNQFRARLIFPAFVSGGSAAARAGEFLCESTSLPASQLGVAAAMYRGRRVPLAGDRTFQAWQFTVINDSAFTIRNAFESWVHQINNVRDNTGIQDPALYSVDMGIDHLDRNDNVIKTYNFIGAFPVTVDAIQLGFGNNDQLETFSVTVEYVNWDTPDLI
jgi:hypothetical protein